MAEEKVHEEFLYYLAHQDELVREYNGKVIVLHDHKVFGTYDSEGEAHRDVIGRIELGSFIIQRCSPGQRDYTFRMPFIGRFYKTK